MGRSWEAPAAGALAGLFSATVIGAPLAQEWLWTVKLDDNGLVWLAFWGVVALVGVGTSLAVRLLAAIDPLPAWTRPGRLSVSALALHVLAWIGFLGATTIYQRAAISVVAVPLVLEAWFLWSRLGTAITLPSRKRSAITAAIASLPATALVTLAAWFIAGFMSGE
ncbi:MAG: hypothetical protein V4510_03885 [bacterium]